MRAAAERDIVVMVTGATGNLGSAAIRQFRAAGARVVAVDRNGAAGPMAAEFEADDGLVELSGIDLTDFSSCRRAVEQTLEAFGRLDVLVNTVGGFSTGPVGAGELENWGRLLTLNAYTAFSISAAVLEPMKAAGYGRLVHIAAAPGLKAGANQAAYAASKAAVIRLTEAIAAENRDNGITANCILPGTIDTPQNRAAMPNAKTDGWVQPADIARLIQFLASPAGGIVTGAAIPATGKI